MNKLLSLLLLLPLFIGCSKDDDELKVPTQINMIAKKDVSGSNAIAAMFYIFNEGKYDPKSLNRLNNMAYEATLINEKGEVIKSIAFGSTKAENKYLTYECNPGKYYIVCCPIGVKPGTILLMNSWKAKEVEAIKNKGVVFEVKFKNLYDNGYIEWDE